MVFIIGILGYLMTGIVAIMATTLIHYVCAKAKGYKVVEFWNDEERVEDLRIVLTDGDAPKNILQEFVDMVMNVVIWPHTIVKLLTVYIPVYYEWYEHE